MTVPELKHSLCWDSHVHGLNVSISINCLSSFEEFDENDSFAIPKLSSWRASLSVFKPFFHVLFSGYYNAPTIHHMWWYFRENFLHLHTAKDYSGKTWNVCFYTPAITITVLATNSRTRFKILDTINLAMAN